MQDFDGMWSCFGHDAHEGATLDQEHDDIRTAGRVGPLIIEGKLDERPPSRQESRHLSLARTSFRLPRLCLSDLFEASRLSGFLTRARSQGHRSSSSMLGDRILQGFL